MDHLTDLDLVLELDGELPARQSRRVRRHLTACWSCRSRQVALSNGIGDFTRLYHRQFDGPLPSGDQATKLLVAHLNEAERIDKRVPGRSRLPAIWGLRIGAGAVLLLMVWSLVQFTSGRRTPEHLDAVRPDRTLSPGLASLISSERVCQLQGRASGPIRGDLAQKVFARYHITRPALGAYEIDYVVPLELGGSQEVENLWPQPYQHGPWNSHTKDALEERLEKLACDGQLSVPEAQAALSGDWIRAYQNYFRSAEPLVAHLAYAKDLPWPFSTRVGVN